MKTKLLRKFRKYWEYKFTKNSADDVLVRRKADGEVITVTGIQGLIRYFSVVSESMFPSNLYYAHSRRRRAIADKRQWNKTWDKK